MVRNLIRNQAPGNRLRVRIPCPPLQNNPSPREYRTSCEFPETSVVSVQFSACRLPRCISRRDRSPKYPTFAHLRVACERRQQEMWYTNYSWDLLKTKDDENWTKQPSDLSADWSVSYRPNL